MFSKIELVIDKITTDVTELKYISSNNYNEITDWPAFVFENLYDFSLEKISINGQIYNSTMKLHGILYTDIDETDAIFKALAEKLLKSIAGTSGFEYIKFLTLRLSHYQNGAMKVRGMEFDVELLSREAWV